MDSMLSPGGTAENVCFSGTPSRVNLSPDLETIHVSFEHQDALSPQRSRVVIRLRFHNELLAVGVQTRKSVWSQGKGGN